MESLRFIGLNVSGVHEYLSKIFSGVYGRGLWFISEKMMPMVYTNYFIRLYTGYHRQCLWKIQWYPEPIRPPPGDGNYKRGERYLVH